MSATESIIQRGKQFLLQNYKQQPIVLDRGEGAFVWDVEGTRYLDFIGGIAVTALGHAHPEVTAAAKAQLDRIWHASNGVWTQPSIDLAEKLTRLSGLDRAFFCNSGAEANEALIKLARKYQKEVAGKPERFEIIAFEDSFHGRTLGTLTLTGQPKYQKGFEPLPAGFKHVPYGDLEAVRKAVGANTAAIMVETIQGEGGVKTPPRGFFKGLRELCDHHGILLLVDEIQTGMGRTGHMFGFQHEGIGPDAISLAKALANGLPIGAMLAREDVAKALTPGSHGSTFGGNPVACAAANVVVSLISDPGMLQSVREKGEYLLTRARSMKERLGGKVADVRGVGLLVGVELSSEAGPAMNRCREGGLIVNLAGERTLRMAPPFVVSREQIDEALGIMEKAISV
ncbi:MAG: acetylornithine transaminase [Myxococcaceae bacterium]